MTSSTLGNGACADRQRESDGHGRVAWAHGAFDVVILDVMLPGISGIELLAQRRRAGDATPVILLTAHDDDRIRDSGMQAGADVFLVKPFVYAELLACVDRLTSRPPG